MSIYSNIILRLNGKDVTIYYLKILKLSKTLVSSYVTIERKKKINNSKILSNIRS